ncbi:MAG: hypothetical protein MUF15_27240 [Acidobacteria bacterium]|jgi:hypothetical protein|nr:hypothetical protein [Acidobacteriota bacterium]
MTDKTIKIIIVILVTFFTLQFFAHVFLKIGEKTGVNKEAFKYSAWFMPFDAEPFFEYGYALMLEKKAAQNKEIFKNKERLLKSIAAFEKAVELNKLSYQGYYNLGKAFLANDLTMIGQSPDFKRGVSAFKRAAFIRGNKSNDIAADTLRLFLSQWPLLKDDDKKFCRDLLERSVSQLGPGDLTSIVDIWQLYCRDIDFLKGPLRSNPQYYINIARELGRLEIDMEMRQEFLANYEAYHLNLLQTMYQKYNRESPDLLTQLKYLAEFSAIAGYYRLTRSTDFNENSYHAFKKKLYLDILQIMFENKTSPTGSQERKDIEHFIFAYLSQPLSRVELDDFSQFLKKQNYFAAQDINTFYIKQLLQFKSGRYINVIEETELFRQSFVMVYRENLDKYIDILLLLADALYESNLAARALTTLEQMEKIAPGAPAVYWRIMKIESMIGPDNNKRVEKKIPNERRLKYYQEVKASRFIEPTASENNLIVYLVDDNKIVVNLKEKIKTAILSGHIFQVFIDGKIYYEGYTGQIKDKDNIVVSFTGFPAKCLVFIKILK